MPRNSSGNYSLPAGNPVVSGTTITTSWANNTLTDLGAEITDSLSRSGDGGMQAPLKLTDGTVAAPALTFTDDPDCGLYRAGANDLRMGINTTRVQTWDTSGSTFNEALATAKGLTATQSTSNTAAITATGNGTAAGVTATGGSSSGAGVSGTGGASNGNGVLGNGSGTGSGVHGVGGASNGIGGSFEGTGSGVGASGTGGATAGAAGLTGTGGSGGGNGVTGTGTGGGTGVAGTGGPTNGAGVTGQGTGTGVGGAFTGGATNATGVTGTGVGTGPGVVAQGGTTGAGALIAHGTAATSGTRQAALVMVNGDIDFSNVTDPSSTTAHSDKLGPKNIIKAWASLSFTSGGGGAVVVDSGFNIASVAFNGNVVRLTFGSGFSSTNYACWAMTEWASASAVQAQGVARATDTVDIRAVNSTTGAEVDLRALTTKMFVQCVGSQ